MNLKTRFVTMAAAVVLVAGGAFADQEGAENNHGKHHGKHVGERGMLNRHGAKLAEALKLTDAQKEQAKAIREEHRAANADLHKQMRDLHTQLRAARQANNTAEAERLAAQREPLVARAREAWNAERAELRNILTAEQQAKLDTMRENIQKSFAGKREGRRARQQ
jgi:Spy/CpxP family protein refolding chaperone